MSLFNSQGHEVISNIGGGGGADGFNILAAGTRTAGTASTVLFSNANGVTFGLDTVAGSIMTASVAAGGGGMGISAGTQSVSTGTMIFANSNGITFGMSGSSQITASHNGLTTAAASDHSHGNPTLALTNLTGTTASNSAGLTLSLSAHNQAFSADASSTFQTLIFQNSNGVSFSNNAGALRVTHDLAGTTTAITGRASITMNSAGLQFNGNGLAGTGFTSTTTAGTAIVATNSTNGLSLAFPTIITNALTTARASNDAVGLNTAQTNVTWTVNSAGLSFNAAGYAGTTTAITGNAVITLNSLGLRFDGSGLAGTGTSATNASITMNSNGLAISVAAPGGGAAVTVSDAASSGTVGRLAFTNLNGVTLSLSTGAGGSHTIVGSHNALTSQSNQAFSAGAASSTFQTLSFQDSNGVSFSNNAGAIRITHALVGTTTAITGGASMTLNSAGIQFNGTALAGTGTTFAGANISGSMTQDTAGLNLSLSVAAPGGGAGVTFPGLHPYDDYLQVVGQVGQGSLIIDPQPMHNFAFDRVGFLLQNTNSSNSSGSHTLSFWMGLYTRNASTLSLHYSMSGSTALTHSGTAGSYSLYSGRRLLPLTVAATTITENRYWIAVVSRTTSGGANGTYSNYQVSNLASNFSGVFGSSTNATYQPLLGQGFYSATTSGMPNSIAFSQIQGTNSLGLRMPIVGFHSGTA